MSRFKTINKILSYLQLPVGKRIEKFLERKQAVFFVQIGSCNGIDGDPIHNLIIKHTSWQGIFVEPVKYNFRKLQENYGYSDRFIFENIAIADKNGKQKFYYIKNEAQDYFDSSLPNWYNQLGSFKKEHIIKHFGLKIEPFIVEENINCITFEKLCQQNKIDKIDLLHIDTEGYDYQIISQVDFTQYCPLVILLEHMHISATDKDKLFLLLKSEEYKIIKYPHDFLALKKRTFHSR